MKLTTASARVLRCVEQNRMAEEFAVTLVFALSCLRLGVSFMPQIGQLPG